MKFKGHQSFYIRKGWLSKGLMRVKNTPTFFTNKQIEQTTELGVGSNMVAAIRYWLVASKLATEKTGKGQTPTHFGNLILQHDKYLQLYGTLLWLHYNIATNKGIATSWYYFFNEYKAQEIDKNSFINDLQDFIKNEGGNIPSQKSLEDDYACILGTYLPRNSDKDSFEDNLECPLAELGLLQIAGINRAVTKKACDINLFPKEIALAVILSCRNDISQQEIKIEEIESAQGNLGKIFNLRISDVATLLERLQKEKYLKIIRTANIENIQLNKDVVTMTREQCLENYYKSEASNG